MTVMHNRLVHPIPAKFQSNNMPMKIPIICMESTDSPSGAGIKRKRNIKANEITFIIFFELILPRNSVILKAFAVVCISVHLTKI